MDAAAAYTFHQTPPDLCKRLLALTPVSPGDSLLEPFAGENNFYNNFPIDCSKEWAEIERGRNYTDVSGVYDWVITNPPFRLQQGEKRVNSFYPLLDFYTTGDRIRKGVAFLGNDRCLATLTPLRLEGLKARGWNLTSITTCNVKKWRGRYFYIVFEKKPPTFFQHILGSF